MTAVATLAPMTLGHRIRLKAPPPPGSEDVLTPAALAFVAELDSAFAGRRCELLVARCDRHERVAAGWTPDFDPATAHIRDDPGWQVRPAFSSNGARRWRLDLEDSVSPTCSNLMHAQAELLDASASSQTRDSGRAGSAEVVVRPRGWHMVDKCVLVDGRPVSAAILDFGLAVFHGAANQSARVGLPQFCLPKLEGHLEARLWNDVFVAAQQMLGIPRGTIRATVLIETIFAAFEMEEILYELREHADGLGAGYNDYLFSLVKTFGALGPDYVLPDRRSLTSDAPFLQAFAKLLDDTRRHRGAYGTTVFDTPEGKAPELAPVRLAPARVTARDLLSVARTAGHVSEQGVRDNVALALRYIDAWLRGHGTVMVDGRTEDVSAAELARCQVWQWMRYRTPTVEGTRVDREMVARLIDEETAALRHEPDTQAEAARTVLDAVVMSPDLPPFLTTWAYSRRLVQSPTETHPC